MCWPGITSKIKRHCGFLLTWLCLALVFILGNQPVMKMLREPRGEAQMAVTWGLLPATVWAHHLGSVSFRFSQAFGWLKPVPVSSAQPRERPGAKTTWLSHPGAKKQKWLSGTTSNWKVSAQQKNQYYEGNPQNGKKIFANHIYDNI